LDIRGIESQNLGKTVLRPKIIIMEPDTKAQASGGIDIKNVLTLRSSVKIIIEKAKEKVTTRTFLLLGIPDTELPIITGSNGNVQGASTVKTPAINETTKSIIVTILYHNKNSIITIHTIDIFSVIFISFL
jgi:hypothetical protein